MNSTVKVIEILGPGCPSCCEAHRVVQEVVDDAKLACRVEKITAIDRMLEFGVLSSPALAFDGTVVLSGRIPNAEDVRRLLGLS